MQNLLVFAGTTEGRELLETLSRAIGGSGPEVYACVATEYGRDVLGSDLEHVQIHPGRMTEDEMAALMEEKRFDFVIDTTHPYARSASENIKAACERAGCSYIRVLRPRGLRERMDCLFFGSHEEAAEYLDRTEGNVLLTVGSKELSKYTGIRDYQKRLFPRVLPMPEALESCFALGFPGKRMICMQGPFTAELNAAMIRQTDARFLVTKDSGAAGGFYEKYLAARETGAALLVIGREEEEEGISAEALRNLLEKTYHLKLSKRGSDEPGQWFPLFTNISGRTVVVIGGGKIAQRRVRSLLDFDCSIRVIARETSEEIKGYGAEQKLELRLKGYEPSDLDGADYVLAATDDRQLNHEIYKGCREGNIPVNVADDKTKSDFYFPGIVRRNGITVGVTAEGKDHSLAKKATRAIADCLDSNIGKI
ncbi:MAG TPA: precorrin-6A reductase [Bacillota bacterium]|nr:precorrin-6A reductase [Bacillota bacterium]